MSQCHLLEQWAAEVSAAAKTMATYYSTAGIAANVQESQSWTANDVPQNVQAARDTLLDTTAKIQQAIIEPEEYLRRLAINVGSPIVIYTPVIFHAGAKNGLRVSDHAIWIASFNMQLT
jgi:GH25 family lysozyme M1 (1,4-beta-N-acetylmuramidase)